MDEQDFGLVPVIGSTGNSDGNVLTNKAAELIKERAGAAFDATVQILKKKIIKADDDKVETLELDRLIALTDARIGAAGDKQELNITDLKQAKFIGEQAKKVADYLSIRPELVPGLLEAISFFSRNPQTLDLIKSDAFQPFLK